MTTLKSHLSKIIKSAKTYLMGTSPTHTSTDTDNNSNSSEQPENTINHPDDPEDTERFTNDEIYGTPFRLVGNDKRGYFIAMGNCRLTEFQKTPEEAKSLLIKEKWKITLNMITTALYAVDELKKQESQHQTTK